MLILSINKYQWLKKIELSWVTQLSSMVMDQLSRPPWSGYGLCGWVLDAGADLLEGRSASEKARDTFVQKQQFAGWYYVPALKALGRVYPKSKFF